MKLRDMITSYRERGGQISLKEIYNNFGNIPVYSATTTGCFGYYNKSNYRTTKNTLVYTLNGVKAGSLLMVKEDIDIWFSTDTGIVEIDEKLLKIYKKETIAVYLQNLFINNRHNNGGQPKFSIKRCLDLEINTEMLDLIEMCNNDEINLEQKIAEEIKEVHHKLRTVDSTVIPFKNIIESYKERGKRLTHAKDIYPKYGGIKVISADIYGAMGYYEKSNYSITENSFIYTIDGKNAGSVLLLKPQNIWLTDHAGVINVKKEFIEKYGRLSIAIYLQKLFLENRDGNGGRPQFLLKKVLNMPINIKYLEILSELNMERLLS